MRLSLWILAALLLAALCVQVPHSMAMWGNFMVASGRGTSGISVVSVALSNTTFPNNTANAPVGTLSAVMSDSSTFTGVYTPSGVNSGGFHVVGNQLQTNGAGTTNGTYNDLTITATQSGAAGAPFIQPTLTGTTGMACDVGQSYPGSIPVALTNRIDLQHCAWYSDFNNAAYANPSSNWVGCYSGGFAPTTPGINWYQQGNNGAAPTMPCSTIQQVFDGTISKNVLNIKALGSAYSSSGDSQQIVTVSHACGQVVGCTDIGTFPPNYYAEITFRAGATSIPATNGNPVLSWWSYPLPRSGATCNRGCAERDFFELYGPPPAGNCTGDSNDNQGGGPVWGFGNDGNPLTPCGPYYKLGIRMTSNGTNSSYCAYVNGALAGIGCVTATNNPPPGGGLDLALRSYFILSNSNVQADFDYFIQYMVVFSCTSWQTGLCNGAPITGTP